jgi:hypothetical protein
MSKQSDWDHAIQLLAPPHECSILPIPCTKAQFLDQYSAGITNLSSVPQPSCFVEGGLMLAPSNFRSKLTSDIFERYINLPHWKNKHVFKKLIGKLRKSFNVDGMSISVVTESKTLIKIETLINVSEIPKSISFDGHAILSKDYFLILDATADWRFKKNPFVTGIPYIKFYCGVPILTAKNEVIGILSIYDSFAKLEFSIEACNLLKEFAREVITIIETPIDELDMHLKSKENCNNEEINDLTWKLGRATSTKPMMMTVFEKDGSGGRYTLNHNFRFSKELQKKATNEPNNERLWQKLSQIKSIKNAAMIFTRAFCKYYHFDFAYILEIKTSELYLLPLKLLPKDTFKVSYDDFKYKDKMIKNNSFNYDCLTRIVGINGTKHSSLSFDNQIHYQAFTSDHGISYKTGKKPALYNCGVIIPFHKNANKLIRMTQQNKSTVDVTLRRSGYLIAAFNENHNNFTTSTIENIFKDAFAFRNLYIA